MTCDICERPVDVGMAYIDGWAPVVCRRHFNLWQKTPEDISLRDWLHRILHGLPEDPPMLAKSLVLPLLASASPPSPEMWNQIYAGSVPWE